MFIIKTQEKQADPRQNVDHRVLVYRDDTLHVIHPWDESLNDEMNHRAAALASLLKSSPIPGRTPHKIIGAASVPGEDYWVVVCKDRGAK
jgi:hypothetical protein